MGMYIQNFFRYFSYFFLVPFVIPPSYTLVNEAHKMLADDLPSLFHTYNQITEEADYLAQRAVIYFIAAIIPILFAGILSVALDNRKYEHLIDKTSGLYTLKDGFSIYLEEFLYCDIFCGIAVSLVFTIPSFIPRDLPKKLDRLETFLSTLFKPATAFTDYMGIALGSAFLILFCILSRLLGTYLGLKRWRGLWLSDIER